VKSIVIGQRVSAEKVECAKALRRSMTEAERVLWQHLRSNRLLGLHFRRQQVIRGFVVDFYCHQAALVVEVDGAVHDDQVEQDRERGRILTELGLRIVRFRNEEVVDDLSGVLARIRQACLPLPVSGRGPGG
jgi:very-short-patch-repair endonuclease